MLETIKVYDDLIKESNEIIKALKVYPKILSDDKHKYLHPVFDKALFNALNGIDLITGLKYLDISVAIGNGFESNYFARIVAHSSYEILNHQEKIIGKNVFDLLNSKLGKDASEGIRETTKRLRAIKKDYFLLLKSIRNNLFGHKMESGIGLAEKMFEVNNETIYMVGMDIFKFQCDLLLKMQEIIKIL
jgi:hypothetical protein